MKKTMAAFIITLAVSSASAFGQSGSTGIGIILGEPAGLSLKHFINQREAVDAGLAWSLSEDGNIHIHADYLLHNRHVLQTSLAIRSNRLSLYYGIGGRLRADDDTRLGVRFVLGTAYDFKAAPFDAFFELVPVMDVVPETGLDVNAGLGFRYWFK